MHTMEKKLKAVVVKGVSLSPSFIAILLQLSFTGGLLVAPLLMSRVGRRPQVIPVRFPRAGPGAYSRN